MTKTEMMNIRVYPETKLKWDRITRWYKRKYKKINNAEIFEDVLREWFEKTGL